MGTKIEGDGCYDAALPDEPMFTLLARDPTAPRFVMEWCKQRLADIDAGVRPEEDRQQVSEAIDLANRMIEWREKNLDAWKDAQTNGVGIQNAERAATLAYLGQRIQGYNLRINRAEKEDDKTFYKIAASTVGVIAGDIRAGFHLTGKAIHPAEHLGETAIDLPSQEPSAEPPLCGV